MNEYIWRREQKKFPFFLSLFLQTIKNAPKKYGERAQKFCKMYVWPTLSRRSLSLCQQLFDFYFVSLQKARGLLCGVIYHIIPYLRAADNAKLEGFVKKTAEDDGFLQNMILYLIKILLFCLFLTGNTWNRQISFI